MTRSGPTRIIINPSAAAGRALQRLAPARPVLQQAWPDAEWCQSRNAEHLVELCAEAAAQGYARVIVGGGDGSIHFAVRGLIGSPTALGILPVGTGNDFAGAAGMPLQPLAAAQALVRGVVRPADLGQAGDTPFCCVAGIGMDTPALHYIHQSRLRRGKLLYQLAAIKTLLSYRAVPLDLRLPQHTEPPSVVFAAFCNTPTYAGGNRIVPQAAIDDGRLDYCLFTDSPRWRRLWTFAQMKTARHLGQPGVSHDTFQQLDIGAATPLPLTLDGELTELTTPLTIRVLPGAIQLLVHA